VINLKTNNVTRFLDSRKVHYDVYELPPEKLGAVETAEYLDIQINLVYKSIILMQPNSKPILCMVPGNAIVNLKEVAVFLDQKKVRLTSQAEAEALTGLQTGGISPLALLNRGFIMILDSSAEGLEAIHISGGERGMNLRMQVADLRNITNARVWKISSLPDAKAQ
jgi:Cys-tRNA(Pro)/Cys-tRNA(Cys) deacylase